MLWCVRHIFAYVSQHWQQYFLRITTLTTICLMYHNTINNMSYISEILVSVLWYVRHIVVSVVISKTYCCQCCDTYDILLSVLWHLICITTLTTICLTYQNIDNNASYVSQKWQPNVLRATTLTTVKRMTYCCHGCDTSDIFLSVLWYVRHIVVNIVIPKRYCCQCCDTVLRATTLTTISLTYHNNINNMSYVSQHWQQYVIRITSCDT
jgi:hypothetical protein